MSAAVILALIFSFIGLFLAANAVMQYREKLAAERRHLLVKLATMVTETEELLVNKIQIPMTSRLIVVLLERLIDIFHQIIELKPDIPNIQQRLADVQEELKDFSQTVDTRQTPNLNVPNNEAHIAALIKTIKKVRYILGHERRKGNLGKKEFGEQDGIQAALMVRIFTEYKIAQGNAAIAEHQLGSARQFLEKALKTLNAQPPGGDYAPAKIEEIQKLLKEINAELIAIEPTEESDDENTEDDLVSFLSDTKKKW